VQIALDAFPKVTSSAKEIGTPRGNQTLKRLNGRAHWLISYFFNSIDPLRKSASQNAVMHNAAFPAIW
jgi:hypothetical protein